VADTTWSVHVAGPDDVLPATDRLDAMKRAHDINNATIRYLEINGDHPFAPTVWASPIAPGEPA
jgi:hypothetical protein